MMKTKQRMRSIQLLFLTLLFSACAAVNAAPELDNIQHKAAIIEENKGFMATFSRGDAAAMANLYTADGALMPTHSDFVKGQEAIAAVWQSVFDAGIKQAKLETLEVEGVGDTLYEVGKYTLYSEGDKIADAGKYIVIWKMEDGQWKLHRDIFNTSLPPTSE
jgi:uncharacterized protein (TIGR02246 family)